MKKAALIFASLVLALSCTACIFDEKDTYSDNESAESVTESASVSESASAVESVYQSEKECDFALITDSKGIEDETNMSLWKSIIAYGDSNSKTYQYYTADDIESDGELTVVQAIENGAKIVVLPSSSFKNTVLALQEQYPEVTFLLVNTQPDKKLGDNVHCIKFKEEQAGYLAGYFAVLEGYTTLGFIGDGENDRNLRYVYGFVQGADDATQELRIHDVSIKYTFIDSNLNKAKSASKSMYENGVEAIFACDSTIIEGVVASAQSADKKVICGENEYDEYGDVVLASIAYDTVEAVSYTIETGFDTDLNPLDTNEAKDFNLGVENGCIYIPTEEELWNFEGFNAKFYEEVCQKLVNDEIEVSGETETVPPIATVMYSYYEP